MEMMHEEAKSQKVKGTKFRGDEALFLCAFAPIEDRKSIGEVRI
jgi:hypothetical protein